MTFETISRSHRILILVTACMNLAATTIAAQPALLFDDDDLVHVRTNVASPLFADYWSELQEMDVVEDKNFMREAFLYAVTEDAERGRRAKELLLETTELEYWNNFVDGDERLGFLRAGRVTSWVALAYDWLYDLLTDEEREAVREALAEKGCVPLYRALYGMRYPETVTGWGYAPYAPSLPRIEIVDMSRWPEILGHNNFRAIINGGLMLGLTVLEGHDERTEEWKELTLYSIEFFNDLLKDDGSYDEAVNYLNYAMTYQVYAMEVAHRKHGVNFYDSANFPGMIDYVLAMYLPSYLYGHGSLTFGDAGNSLRSATSFWVARYGRDGLAQYVGERLSDHDVLSPLYYDPSVAAEPPVDGPRLDELDLDWIISRSGYSTDDFVLGMRSGAPMNHEHGDRNSVQLKTYGEILLADHRRITYYSEDPEWEWRGSLGHNSILIDGRGHQYHDGREGTNESKSHATIVRAAERPDYHFWASDASQAYQLVNPDVGSVTRTVISFPETPAFVIADKVVMQDGTARVSSRWHLENGDGLASDTVADGHFVIQRPNARLLMKVAGDQPQSIERGRFDSENKDHPFRFVEVFDESGSSESFRITVGIPLRPAESEPAISIERDGNTHSVRLQKDATLIHVRIIDEGPLPEFEVVMD